MGICSAKFERAPHRAAQREETPSPGARCANIRRGERRWGRHRPRPRFLQEVHHEQQVLLEVRSSWMSASCWSSTIHTGRGCFSATRAGFGLHRATERCASNTSDLWSRSGPALRHSVEGVRLGSGTSTPEEAPASTMPAHDGIGRDERQVFAPASAEAARRTLQLVAQQQVLEHEILARSN
jgi:hypothetical protein